MGDKCGKLVPPLYSDPQSLGDHWGARKGLWDLRGAREVDLRMPALFQGTRASEGDRGPKRGTHRTE